MDKMIGSGWKPPVETYTSKTKLKREIIEINNAAMEYLQNEQFDK